jgi:hypothetical protein
VGTGLQHLRRQGLRISATGGQPYHAETLRVAVYDVESLDAD